MHLLPKIIFASLALIAANTSIAQETESVDDAEQLKMAALEALMSAPSERALPIIEKVLSGDNSDAVKSRALFVLSQLDMPEAQTLLLETARNGEGQFRLEAIRMIGIGGDPDALAGLADIYSSGDGDVRQVVLRAYLIADDSNAVYELAANATSDEDFESAVHILGVMGAIEKLRLLRDREGNSETLIHAYAISGDVESLRVMALDSSDPEKQTQAMQGLGIVGGSEVSATLLEIYRGTESSDVKEAALRGMMVAGDEESVVELFRASQDAKEKRKLLQMLVVMDSDAAMQIIDEALDGGQ